MKILLHFLQVPLGYFELGHSHYGCSSQGCVCTICRLQPPAAQEQSQINECEQSQILDHMSHSGKVALVGFISLGAEFEEGMRRFLVSRSFSVFSVSALSIGS